MRALAEANHWLRTDATVCVKRQWIEDQLDDNGTLNRQLESARGRIAGCDAEELLFASKIF